MRASYGRVRTNVFRCLSYHEFLSRSALPPSFVVVLDNLQKLHHRLGGQRNSLSSQASCKSFVVVSSRSQKLHRHLEHYRRLRHMETSWQSRTTCDCENFIVVVSATILFYFYHEVIKEFHHFKQVPCVSSRLNKISLVPTGMHGLGILILDLNHIKHIPTKVGGWGNDCTLTNLAYILREQHNMGHGHISQGTCIMHKGT